MTAFTNRRYLVKIVAIMYGLFFLFLSLTSPSNLPILLLIAPVIWLFFCLTLTVLLCINIYRLKDKVIDRKDVIYAASGAGVSCVILLLRSVNQLNARDVLLIIFFLAIASFYLSKIRMPTKL